MSNHDRVVPLKPAHAVDWWALRRFDARAAGRAGVGGGPGG